MNPLSVRETYQSLADTFPGFDQSGWSLHTLLTRYGELAVIRCDAIAADAPEGSEIEADLASIASEIEQRVVPGARDAAAVRTLESIRSGLVDLIELAGGEARAASAAWQRPIVSPSANCLRHEIEALFAAQDRGDDADVRLTAATLRQVLHVIGLGAGDMGETCARIYMSNGFYRLPDRDRGRAFSVASDVERSLSGNNRQETNR